MSKLKDNISRKDLLYKKYKEYDKWHNDGTWHEWQCAEHYYEILKDISLSLAIMCDNNRPYKVNINNNGIDFIPVSVDINETDE